MSAPITISSLLGIENQRLTTNDHVRGINVGQWGVDADGNAYFSPAGNVPATDRAFLSLDANGTPVLRHTGAAATTRYGWLVRPGG